MGKQRFADKKKMGLFEFARRLHRDNKYLDRIAFFLGAGCSRSSEILVAKELVEQRWLPEFLELHDRHNLPKTDQETFLKGEFPDYDPAAPANLYSELFKRLYPVAAVQQRVIEELCKEQMPGFGYGVLATLMATDAEHHCNLVLTTNFDDLLIDAFYLYTTARPLVIHHDALSGYIQPTERRPLVVKLHGDLFLTPRNEAEQLLSLDNQMEKRVAGLLQGAVAVVFLGYGGHDKSVAKLFCTLPDDALQGGLYWVNTHQPHNPELLQFLENRNAQWVDEGDFDRTAVALHSVFDLIMPDKKRIMKVFDKFGDTFAELNKRETAAPADQPESSAMKAALDKMVSQFQDWWSVELAAQKFVQNNPDEADRIYRQGIEKFPQEAALLNNYARFLHEVRKDATQAESYYLRALEADPNHATILGNYAGFLQKFRKDALQAERFYLRALEADPNHATILGNYASFLHKFRKDAPQAESFYRRALEADTNDATNLGNYALFLHEVLKDAPQAESYYHRALEADPNDANTLGNYANFLHYVRKDAQQAENYYHRALEADPNDATNLGNYASFLYEVRKDAQQAENYYRRALDANPNHAVTLGNFANFLNTIRKDAPQAESFYRRALVADPNHAIIHGNVAGFLLGQGEREEGLALLKRARELEKDNEPLRLELVYYGLAHAPQGWESGLEELRALLKNGVRSPGWDLSANWQRAQLDGHSQAPFLQALAMVVADTAKLDSLDGFDCWKNRE